MIRVILLLVGLSCVTQVLGIKSTEQAIWDSIIKDGDSKEFFPGKNQRLNVSIGLTLAGMSDYREDSGDIEVTYWLSCQWTVPGISWDSEKFDNIRQIHVSATRLWTPDIVPFKLKKVDYSFDKSSVVISNEGLVIWVPSLVTTVPCFSQKDGPLYPRDRKSCNMKLGSWVYSSQQMNLSASNDKVDLLFNKQLGNWKFVDVVQQHDEKKYPCCVELYQSMLYNMTIERSDMYFGLATAVPGIAIGLIVALLYLLPPPSPARVLSQVIGLLILVFVGVTDLRIIGTTKVIAPAAKYIMAAMLLDLIAILWSIIAAVLWMQSSESKSQGCLDSLLSKLECICCLPASSSSADDAEGQSHKGSKLSPVQRFCLFLDRLFCLVNIVLFILMFVCLGI